MYKLIIKVKRNKNDSKIKVSLNLKGLFFSKMFSMDSIIGSLEKNKKVCKEINCFLLIILNFSLLTSFYFSVVFLVTL